MPWQEVMHKWKAGKLHSGGPKGRVVRNRKQAIAIMLSEKRRGTHEGPAGRKNPYVAAMQREK